MDGEGEPKQRIDARKEVRKAERDPWNRLNSIVQVGPHFSLDASSLSKLMTFVSSRMQNGSRALHRASFRISRRWRT